MSICVGLCYYRGLRRLLHPAKRDRAPFVLAVRAKLPLNTYLFTPIILFPALPNYHNSLNIKKEKLATIYHKERVRNVLSRLNSSHFNCEQRPAMVWFLRT